MLRASLSRVLPKGINANEFASWLGPALGTYRSAISQRAATTRGADEAQHVHRLIASIEQTLHGFKTLSPRAKAGLRLGLWKASDKPGAIPGEIAQRLQLDLIVMRVILTEVLRGLSVPAARGRKSEIARDVLLAAIVEQLAPAMVNKAAARRAASDVLKHCRITPPGESESARKAERRGKK